MAQTPGGGTTKLYMEPDKNKNQIRREVNTRRLRRVIEDNASALKLRIKKEVGLVSHGAVPLARLLLEHDGIAEGEPPRLKIEWNKPLVAKLSVSHKLDKEAIEAEFHKPRADVEVQWGLYAPGGGGGKN